MSNFLLYSIQRQGIFYIVRLCGTTHTRRFFFWCLCPVIQSKHTHKPISEIQRQYLYFCNDDSLDGLKLPQWIPTTPASIQWWGQFLPVRLNFLGLNSWTWPLGLKLWTQRLNINIDVQSRDQTVVLESLVEVNDFSELWPSEADTASQVPLILLLSGRVRKSRKKTFIFSMLLTEFWYI